jgi:hypothetical protein
LLSVASVASASADEHPDLLQYLTKLGIDHDIARQYLSQIDFKAPQGTWSYFALVISLREGFLGT